jgi:integrase
MWTPIGSNRTREVEAVERQSSVTLTKTVVDAAERRSRRYDLWDDKLSGFGLRIEASGTKTFIVRYRANGGGRKAPRRFMTIGRFGNLTVEEARKKAKAVLGAAANGDDPAGERQAQRREMLMSELIDFYEKEGCFIQRGIHQGQPMKPLTKKNTMARLRNHVVPLLGRKRVSEVSSADVERFVRDVTAGKTNRDEKEGRRKRVIVRGGEGAARKVVRDLSAVFSFAQRRQIADSNPVALAAVRKTDNVRDRFLTLAEVTRLGRALDELQTEGENVKGIQITRLWALTGCRRDEIASLKWSEVDFERGLLVLADSKTRKSIRPLSSAAALVLKKVTRDADSRFVFPAEKGEGHYQGTKRIWKKIVTKAKLPGVTPHTLRHTIGSTAVSFGEGLPLTGALLGHANPRSTAIYAHVQNDPSKRAANRVSGRIAAALSKAS